MVSVDIKNDAFCTLYEQMPPIYAPDDPLRYVLKEWSTVQIFQNSDVKSFFGILQIKRYIAFSHLNYRCLNSTLWNIPPIAEFSQLLLILLILAGRGIIFITHGDTGVYSPNEVKMLTSLQK